MVDIITKDERDEARQWLRERPELAELLRVEAEWNDVAEVIDEPAEIR